MNNLRLEKIYLEAGRLFNTKGYINTKVSEIAEAVRRSYQYDVQSVFR